MLLSPRYIIDRANGLFNVRRGRGRAQTSAFYVKVISINDLVFLFPIGHCKPDSSVSEYIMLNQVHLACHNSFDVRALRPIPSIVGPCGSIQYSGLRLSYLPLLAVSLGKREKCVLLQKFLVILCVGVRF